MSLAKTLLRKVPDWRPAAHTQEVLAVSADDSPWSARLTADRCDELASALWELNLEPIKQPLELSADQLRTWARKAAEAHGLLEPLALLELDQPRGEALVRSAQPTERDDAVLYYEILLSARGRVRVCRYRASRCSGDREQTPFVLSHEALARVSDELTEGAM